MTYEDYQQAIRMNVMRIMAEQGMTIAELAKASATSAVTISMFLNGHRSISLYTVFALAGALGMTRKDLMD